ncbi:hypothetical protein [Kineococcus xinjiangensis]|uniref:hypothetical protein n=1 Tax=Kineococcus xinjiangensis TaxID=512762 RepID=UPI0011B0C2F8|nr:hypothetical protein [Kineococcus xinjiangensis]
MSAAAAAAWLTFPADDSTWPMPGVLLTTVALTVVANLRIGGWLCVPVVVASVLVGLTVALKYHGYWQGDMGSVMFLIGTYLTAVAVVASVLTTIVKYLFKSQPAS